MYCRYCGSAIPADAAFCPHCGNSQPAKAVSKGGLPDWLIVALLIFVPPLGWILMWTSSRWKVDVKAVVTFPPAWPILFWRLSWPPLQRLALIAALVAATVLWFGSVAGPTAATAILFVIVVIAALVIMTSRPREAPDTGLDQLRQMIESKVDTCHDLIDQIERTLAFDLLPSDSPVRSQYMHALEMRSEGMALFERATTRPDLVAADARLSRAMEELRTARDAADRTLT